tara:strand:+ start:337 stop:1542 length:1206 start_codon:yes stop_codon:yes gene_type:complete
MDNKYLVRYRAFPLLIFMGGFTNNIIPTLILFLKNTQFVSTSFAMLLQCLFFISFLIIMFPSALLIKYIGYRGTIVTANSISALAFVLLAVVTAFNHGNHLHSAIFVLACGNTLLRISITPLLVSIRSEKNYHLSISQLMCADTIGAMLSPIISAQWILDPTLIQYQPSQFFLLMAICFFGIAYMCSKITFNSHTPKTEISIPELRQSINHPTIRRGCLATFIFIGLEFSIPIFLGLYINDHPNIIPFSPTSMISCYWTLILVGRIASFKLLKYYSPRHMLYYGSLAASALIFFGMNLQPMPLAICLTLLGLCNAYMFPCIFSIYTEHLSPRYHYYASSVFLMAFSGGAAIPYAQALLSSQVGIISSFYLIICCYILLLLTTTWLQPSKSTYVNAATLINT